MGIPVYFSHIIKNYSQILKKIQQKQSFDVFFLDANSIIYDVYYNILKSEVKFKSNQELEKEIIKSTLLKLRNLYDMFKIKKEIVVCFDGVAPISKLKQQRSRRFKTWITKTLENDHDSTSWNTCSISPGTTFMDSLNHELEKMEKEHNSDSRNTYKLTILTSEFPGEGEQKLFEYLRKNYPLVDNIDENMKKNKINICIYGLDSDLIMLSILHNNFYENIYLYRDTPEFIRNINKSFDPNTNYLLNINLLSHFLTIHANGESCASKNINKDKFRCNINYIILFFLVGNDFIPHHPGLSLRLNGAQDLHNMFTSVLKTEDLFYIEDNLIRLDWYNLKRVLKELSKIEKCNMKEYNTYKTNIKQKMKFNRQIVSNKSELLKHIPIFHNGDESYIVSHDEYISKRYYESSFSVDFNIQDICFHYLKNIEWNLDYYLGQSRCDYTYFYPYEHAPLFEDCVKYVPLRCETLCQSKSSNTSYKFIHPITQLLYILPSCYYDLIDTSNIYMYSLKENRDINILFEHPSNLIIRLEHDFVKYFFESSIVFKHVNIHQLENHVSKIIQI